MLICPALMTTSSKPLTARPAPKEEPPVFGVLPPETRANSPFCVRRDAMRLFFVGLMGVSILAFSLDSGRGASAGNEVPVVAAEGEASVVNGGTIKKSRKTEPSESMGISLSVESQDAEVKQEEGALGGRRKAGAALAGTEKKKSLPKKARAKVNQRKPALVVKETKTGLFAADFVEAEKKIVAKEWKGAVGAYNKILKKDPKNEEALRGKVYALDQNGSDKALDLLDEMAEKYPRMAEIHAARARILARQNDTVEALAAWERAVELDPKNDVYGMGLAFLNDRMGREAEALRLYRKFSKTLSPDARKRMEYLSDKE